MRQLEALTREAIALGKGSLPSSGATGEAARQLEICNACRYCEGFCAVFPAMTRRLEFTASDVHYLANLCHNCGACLHACQYAPPHEFAVNIPKVMAQVRQETYEAFAWPASFGALYRRNGLVLALATFAAIAAFLGLLLVSTAMPAPGTGDFYAVFPHKTLVAVFGGAFLWAIVALAVGAWKFWRGQSPGHLATEAASEALHNALTLTYLDGGHGEGCNEKDDRFTLARRRFHHLTFYGFMLCFAATCVATLYHYALDLRAPYPVTSLPVVLGTLGGLGLLAGPAGLFWLNLRRSPEHGDVRQRPMDRAFIALLFITSASGLVLLAARQCTAMPALLAIHLGAVLALFLTLPYGKFAHAVYRCAALLKWSIEKRLPGNLRLGAN